MISALAEHAGPFLLLKVIWDLNDTKRIFLSTLYSVIIYSLSEASISFGYASRSTSLNVEVFAGLLFTLLRLIFYILNSIYES